MSEHKNDKTVDGKELKAALDKLQESLGTVIVQALAIQFEKQGISFEGGPYTWEQIRGVLETIFVDEGCDLIEYLLKKTR